MSKIQPYKTFSYCIIIINTINTVAHLTVLFDINTVQDNQNLLLLLSTQKARLSGFDKPEQFWIGKILFRELTKKPSETP